MKDAGNVEFIGVEQDAVTFINELVRMRTVIDSRQAGQLTGVVELIRVPCFLSCDSRWGDDL